MRSLLNGTMMLTLLAALASPAGAQQRRDTANALPTLGLERGRSSFETPALRLELVQASQTVAALRPNADLAFDFTPGDWLERRQGNGFYHLGDLNLRLRLGGEGAWQQYSTAAARKPVEALAVASPVLAGADLAATLPAGIPLRVRRYWEVVGGQLALRFELRNRSDRPVELGGVGIPLIFDNILEAAHAGPGARRELLL